VLGTPVLRNRRSALWAFSFCIPDTEVQSAARDRAAPFRREPIPQGRQDFLDDVSHGKSVEGGLTRSVTVAGTTEPLVREVRDEQLAVALAAGFLRGIGQINLLQDKAVKEPPDLGKIVQ